MSNVALKSDAELRDNGIVAERQLRVLFALPGFHWVNRGAEVALESVAREMARAGHKVTLIGAGRERREEPYRFIHAGCIGREKFGKMPMMPFLHSECLYEDMSFAPSLLMRFRPDDYDVTVTCSYPYTNWVLRSGWRPRGRRPAHVYVTQNADWPCSANGKGLKLFSCEGLVCTNPEYFERNKERWNCVLIPNGVDPSLFAPGTANRAALALPAAVPIVLMVSALIPSKRVLEGIKAVAQVNGAHLVVAGDGPMRREVEEAAAKQLPGRFHLLSFPQEKMPELYRCADVFLHMSMIEAFGNVYIEALASGLPIIAHDRDVSRWMLEEHAVYVDTLNHTAVVEGIETALAKGKGSETSSSSDLVSRRYTWSAIAEQYAMFFNKVLKSSRAGLST